MSTATLPNQPKSVGKTQRLGGRRTNKEEQKCSMLGLAEEVKEEPHRQRNQQWKQDRLHVPNQAAI